MVLNFCFEELHHVTISHEVPTRHAQPIGINDLSGLEHSEETTSVTEMVVQRISEDQLESQEFSLVTPMQIFYMINQLYQG